MVAVRRRAVAVAIPAAAALAAACLSLPPYQPANLVSYMDDADGGATVQGSDFALHFAGGSGFHLPDALRIDSADVMGHDTTSACWGQSATGFAVVPTPRISADGGAPAVTNRLTAVLRGPAVVQVKLEWNTRFASTCSHNRTPGGTSTFTVFPNGAILRHDKLDDVNPDQEQSIAAQCQCPDPPPLGNVFIMSSYWTFDRAHFPQLAGLGPSRDPAKPIALDLPAAGSNTSNFDTMCLDGGAASYQVASVWVVPLDAGSQSRPSPVMFGETALVTHDLQKPSVPTLDFRWDIHGALFVERAGCTAAFKRAIEYTAPAALTVDHAALLPSPLDGIYGGDGGDGQPGIAVQGGSVTLTGALKYPFAVWLRFARAIDLPRATRARATGAWYVPQRVGDRDWIVWFREPIAEGETITVAEE